MLIFFEWLAAFFFFCIAMANYNASTMPYNADYSSYETNVGTVFMLLCVVMAIIALVHTYLNELESGFKDWNQNSWNDWYDDNSNTYINYEKRNESYKPHKTSTVNTTYIYKTQQDIVKDITKDYPLPLAQVDNISYIQKYEVPKTNIITQFFKKEKEVTTAATTVSTSKVESVIKDDAEKDVLRVFSLGLQEYVYRDYIPIVMKHILHIHIDKETVTIFLRPSTAISVIGQVNRNCVIKCMKKNIKDKNIKSFVFIEIEENKYKKYYENEYSQHS